VTVKVLVSTLDTLMLLICSPALVGAAGAPGAGVGEVTDYLRVKVLDFQG
jgi:hypothetical protein